MMHVYIFFFVSELLKDYVNSLELTSDEYDERWQIFLQEFE